jgi:hypothetical protein
MVTEIAVDIFHTVMPVQDEVALTNRPQPVDTQIYYILKMPKGDD